MFKIILIVLVCTVAGIVVFAAVENFTDQIVSYSESAASIDSDFITITISGEITRPGTYIVDAGASLQEAIKKASGATSNADPLAFNTDYICEDGMSFYIAPIYDNGDTCAVTPISKVNINEADKEGLMAIPGVGDSIATALITYREGTALYRRLEEIKNCPGIGEATFSKAKDHMRLKNAN
jgi:competence protein ComEA